jgi:hypothetical protein
VGVAVPVNHISSFCLKARGTINPLAAMAKSSSSTGDSVAVAATAAAAGSTAAAAGAATAVAGGVGGTSKGCSRRSTWRVPQGLGFQHKQQQQ